MKTTELKQTNPVLNAGETVWVTGIYRCSGSLGQTKYVKSGGVLPKCTCTEKNDCKWTLEN